MIHILTPIRLKFASEAYTRVGSRSDLQETSQPLEKVHRRILRVTFSRGP
jgi:hypothetical protein